jgi:hypothetical protein
VSFTNNQSQFPTASSSSRSPASPKMASRSVLDDHGLSSVELDPEGRLASPHPKPGTLTPNTPTQSKASSSQRPRHSLLPLFSPNSPSPTSSHAVAPSCLSTCDCARAPVPLASRIVALWEGVHGVWTVFAEDGEVDELVSLVEWWREVSQAEASWEERPRGAGISEAVSGRSSGAQAERTRRGF